jgi:radical SAM protein with 4Fe4S-binding SPASM domain
MEHLVDSIIAMRVKAVYFSGGGEPTAYPHLVHYVNKLYKAGLDVALLTNGSMLEETGIIDNADNFNYIAVSVPSVTADNFKHITGSDRLENVLNCAGLIKARHKDKSPIVGARVVVTSIIYREIKLILETLKDKQYDYALFKIVRDYEDRGLGVNERETEEIKAIIESLKPVDTNFTNLDTIFNYRSPVFIKERCIANEIGLLANVNSDGKVYPNIVEIGQDDFCIGDLYNETLEKMWHGTAHKAVKLASHKKWLDRKCKNCRAMAYNQIIYDELSQMPSIVENFV